MLAAIAIIIAGIALVVHLAQRSQDCSHSSYQQYLHQEFPDATPAPGSNSC